MKKDLIGRINRLLIAKCGTEDCAPLQELVHSFYRLLEIAEYYHDTKDKVHRTIVKTCPDCKAINEANQLRRIL